MASSQSSLSIEDSTVKTESHIIEVGGIKIHSIKPINLSGIINRSIHGNNKDRINAMFLDVRHMSQLMPATFNHSVWNRQTLSKLTSPIYLVWEDGDDLFPVEIAVELYKNLPDSRLWVIPGQGHTPLWTIMGGDEYASASFPGIAEEFFTEYSGERATAAQI
jgi:hypothetical protein